MRLTGLLFCFLSLSTWGQISITDPKNLLNDLNLIVKNSAFNESFKCDSSFNFFSQVGICRLECDEIFCKETCPPIPKKPVKFYLEDCQSDSVQMYSSLGQSWNITNQDFIDSKFTVVFTMLRNISAYKEPVVSLELETIIFPKAARVIEDGKLKNITTVLLGFAMKTSQTSSMKQSIYITIDPNRQGMDQLMFLSDSPGPGDGYILKRKGFINEN